MKLYSTNNSQQFYSLKEAVMKGLPDDNGLFMPKVIPTLPEKFFADLKNYSFKELSFEICKNLFQNSIPEKDLSKIINNAITFPAPVVHLDEDKSILELFHGPSLAFKDFGARFMSQLMSYFNQGEKKELVILVATSGDTGGAVAAGFLKAKGIKVVILYPSGKVSMLQEKQLTTLGHNIEALEVDGTFDDCQALVKQAFLDEELNKGIRLSSANSINIARLIPQSFYYFEAYKQLETKKEVAFVIPSGNFGNLTAGLFAKRMGLPVKHFVAATNANNIVPDYLNKGTYISRSSVPTISNAMEVGAPSNFARMLDLYSLRWNGMREEIKGYSFSDDETRKGIKEVFDKYNYVIDPHGAVGYLALQEFQKQFKNTKGIILETAHPSKFNKEVEAQIKKKVDIPTRLSELASRKKVATSIGTDFESFKSLLKKKYG